MMLPALWNNANLQTLPAAFVNHLWQSTLVMGLAWLLTLALKKNHARTRYWVWMIASAKFLIPFSLFITAGEWIRSLVAAPIEKPGLAAAMEQITQPFQKVEFFDAVGPMVAAHRTAALPAALLVIWAIGVLVFAARWASGWLRIRTDVRAASPLAFAADVPVRSSLSLLEPGIFGIFRPMLLLPRGIMDRLTPEQLRSIVAHEMCHVRRRDNLTYTLHMAVEVVFWFYPPVRWIGTRLLEERERACDEAVIEAGGEAQVYAEGILNVCKFYVESPVACAAGVTG
jgi:beta-lactamase regulating signal transducer with metallopeptidase domain